MHIHSSSSLRTVGDLELESRDEVSSQGQIVATSDDGSTLAIIPGNGDEASFDVRVQSVLGFEYVRRFGYTAAYRWELD